METLLSDSVWDQREFLVEWCFQDIYLDLCKKFKYIVNPVLSWQVQLAYRQLLVWFHRRFQNLHESLDINRGSGAVCLSRKPVRTHDHAGVWGPLYSRELWGLWDSMYSLFGWLIQHRDGYDELSRVCSMCSRKILPSHRGHRGRRVHWMPRWDFL
jgi:hypothetical protein